MSIALLLAEPDVALAKEIKLKLESHSVPHEILHDSKDWVSQVQNKKFSHVILNYELEKEITDLLLNKLKTDHGSPKVILVISEQQRPFIKKSILENTSICQILSFPYTIQQVLNCLEEKKMSHSKYMTVRTLAVKVMEEVYTKGLSEQNIIYAQKVAESISTMVQKEKDYSEILKTLEDYKPIVYAHPYIVCVISMMICKKLKWDSQRTLSAVALGALIHDIGMTTLDPELRIKPPQSMTPEELKAYRNHPVESMNMANAFSTIPSAVLQIVLQHHEANGKGFPGEISGTKIYPLAKVVALADKFTRYLIDNDLAPMAGLKKFLSDRIELLQHDPEMIKALIKSFIKDDKTDSKESV
jgi:HD-GYP domain-containing protein (c-di-GMP phosphodiesterase class II)